MYRARRPIQPTVYLGAALAAAVMLAQPSPALAESYYGTNSADTIHFGYCAACRSGGPGLLLCRHTGGTLHLTVRALAAEPLVVRGLGGDDVIKAIDGGPSGKTVDGCTFEAFSSLPFTRVYLMGDDGDDTLVGTGGEQRLYGGNGNDYLSGYPGDDYLNGGSGNDYLKGDQGDDRLYGGSGNDALVGGTGVDRIDGGSGVDTLYCRSDANVDDDYEDPADAATDCSDRAAATAVELFHERDPYTEWAHMAYHNQGVTSSHVTTSGVARLLAERAAGASLVMQSFGDLPVAGDFNRNGRADDLAVFRGSDRRWYYDFYADGTTHNPSTHTWGIAGDRPVAGDFDRDGRADDIGLFRPATGEWFFNFGKDSTTNRRSVGFGRAGDLPLAGDFNCDGRTDDVAVYRPADRTFRVDIWADGTQDGAAVGPLGSPGDVPVVGDFDRDGCVNDVALFQSETGTWVVDIAPLGGAVVYISGIGELGDMPVAGDFDRDGYNDDVGVFRPGDGKWYYDMNLLFPGTWGRSYGPWGVAGEPRGVVHKQYGQSCGPSSLNMVVEQLGFADQSRAALSAPRDIDGSPVWPVVALGYHGSAEHILYEGFRNERASDATWNNDTLQCMTQQGVLNTSAGRTRAFYGITYDLGVTNGNGAPAAPRWAEACGAVGGSNLISVADQLNPSHDDARSFSTATDGSGALDDMSHLRDIIRAFVDHGIPMVAAVEAGGHFNTIVGYWERADGFFIYLADPLDGWGRPFYSKPMRWRRIALDASVTRTGSRLFDGLTVYGHGAACQGLSWARAIDLRYRNNLLCDHVR